VRRLAIGVMVGAFALALAGTASAGPAESEEQLAPVHVLQVTGLVDGIVINEIDRAIDRAQADDAQALILQMDIEGTVADSDEVQGLLQRVADTDLAVAVWVGPARSSRAYGQAAQLLGVADVTAMVRGARIGYIGEPLVVDGAPVSFGEATAKLIDGSLDFDAARSAGALKLFTTDEGIPNIRNMVATMDGVEVDGVVLNTAVPSSDGDGQQFDATTPVFFKLGLVDRLLHTVVDPSMAYLLFVIGLALLVFEFFTAGVGIAAGVGVICTVLGSFGLGELPTRHRSGAVRRRLVVPVPPDPRQRRPRRLDHARRRHRRRCTHLHQRHAVDGAHPLRHADDRSGVDDRLGRHRHHVDSTRGRCAGGRGTVAGSHQPGDADQGRRRAARDRHRRCHPGSRARRRCRT
jgi:hypothetical protein